MLRDESSCDGGSIVEKLKSFVQGTVRMVKDNSAHCYKLCCSSEFNLTTINIFIHKLLLPILSYCMCEWQTFFCIVTHLKHTSLSKQTVAF